MAITLASHTGTNVNFGTSSAGITATSGSANQDLMVIGFAYNQGAAQPRQILLARTSNTTNSGAVLQAEHMASTTSYAAVWTHPHTTAPLYASPDDGGVSAITVASCLINHDGRGYRVVDFAVQSWGGSGSQSYTYPAVTSTATDQIIVRAVLGNWGQITSIAAPAGGGYAVAQGPSTSGSGGAATYWKAASGGAEGTDSSTVAGPAGYQLMTISMVLAPVPNTEYARIMSVVEADTNLSHTPTNSTNCAIARDGNGRIWHIQPLMNRVYYSDDDGLTWGYGSAPQLTTVEFHSASATIIDNEVFVTYQQNTAQRIVMHGMRISGNDMVDGSATNGQHAITSGQAYSNGHDAVKLPNGKYLVAVWAHDSSTQSIEFYEMNNAGASGGRVTKGFVTEGTGNECRQWAFQRSAQHLAASNDPSIAGVRFVSGSQGTRIVYHRSGGGNYTISNRWSSTDTFTATLAATDLWSLIMNASGVNIPRYATRTSTCHTLSVADFYSSSAKTWGQEADKFGLIPGGSAEVYIGGRQLYVPEVVTYAQRNSTTAEEAYKGLWYRRWSGDSLVAKDADWIRVPFHGLSPTNNGGNRYRNNANLSPGHYKGNDGHFYTVQKPSNPIVAYRNYVFAMVPTLASSGGLDGWGMVPM